jgi:hypothetical protein
MTLRLIVLGLALLTVRPPVIAQESSIGGALIQDEGWELVFAHCSACHSLQLVTSNRGDRDTWLRLIRWMQDTQNLWQIEATSENRLLDYLARNYGAEDAVRRAQLPAQLLPR